MKIKLLFFILCFITFRLTAQTTWYVATNGLNTNTGTNVSSPFATVNKAISVSTCGDSIYVLGGTYHEKINAYTICPDNNRLTIQGDISNRPLIIGDSLATNKYAISATGKGFTFRHLELTSPYPTQCDQSNMVVVGSGDDMHFIDLIIRNSGYDGMKTTSDCNTSDWANNWQVIDCHILNNGLNCPTSAENGDGIDFTHCHNCEIIGSRIENNKGHQVQIKLEARNVMVEDCHIEGTLLFQIGLPGATPQCNSSALNADSVYFRHNVIVAKGDTSEFMFKLADVSHLVIENNTLIKDSIAFANIGFVCFGGCGGSVNWTKTPQSPVLIRNNIFANMSTTPFYAGPDTSFFDPFNITATEVSSNFNLFYDLNGAYSIPVDGGPFSFVANPMFCDYPASFELNNNSPCINTGDPSSALDPNGTQNDIGANYYQMACTSGLFDLPYQAHRFSVFPNPANQQLNISFNSIQSTEQNLQFFNVFGEMVLEVSMLQSAIIDISTLASGLYFVALRNQQEPMYKLVKQ